MNLLTAEHCEHFLRGRRSIRACKDKPASRADISSLIEVARYVPSGHNSQRAKCLLLNKRDELRNFEGIVADWMRWIISNMPELALVMHMDRALQRWENDNDVILRDAPVLIIAHAEKDNWMAPSTRLLALIVIMYYKSWVTTGCISPLQCSLLTGLFILMADMTE